ncbi:MAG: LysR family transcriptional regulator [Oscillospiraceae bacterium]|nr:LysR family transcriptional regulator [Oscillospiraceae bacterium]
MFDEYLKTFICAAESGSFIKTAEILYLSPNAVKKRITSLEESLGFLLFERTLKGIKLTPAGKSFYNDSKKLVQSYNQAVEKAQAINENKPDFVRIGIMDTFADEFMLANWFPADENIHRAYSSMFFFGTSNENIISMFRAVGKDIDFCVDIYDEKLAKKFGLNSIKLSETKICCAIPLNHRLASKTEISFSDLCGEKIATLKSGRSAVWDNAISKIKEDYFGFSIFEIEKFNIKTFNRCENENRIMLITENSQRVYPFCKCVPLSETYKIPFGLYYSKNSDTKTTELIKIIKSFSPEN